LYFAARGYAVVLVSVGAGLLSAVAPLPFDLDAADDSLPFDLFSPVTALDVDLRLSVMYQPEPLKMIPAG